MNRIEIELLAAFRIEAGDPIVPCAIFVPLTPQVCTARDR